MLITTLMRAYRAVAIISLGLAASLSSEAREPTGDSFAVAAERPQEAANRAAIIRLYFEFFNRHDLGYATKAISADFIQHNPLIPTGRQPFVDFIQLLFQQYPNSQWNIDRIAAGGDLVWLQSHQTNDAQDPGTEIIDIYRIQNGLIVEHWDVFEAVSTAPLNGNTQF